MYAKQEVSTEGDHSREYADTRLRKIYQDHYDIIRTAFLCNPTPKSSKEAEEWLKTGKWHFDVPEDGDTDYFHPFDYFGWGEKKWKPDRRSFRAADKALDKAYDDAKDLIHITTDENKRLEAIESFKTWKH